MSSQKKFELNCEILEETQSGIPFKNIYIEQELKDYGKVIKIKPNFPNVGRLSYIEDYCNIVADEWLKSGALQQYSSMAITSLDMHKLGQIIYFGFCEALKKSSKDGKHSFVMFIDNKKGIKESDIKFKPKTHEVYQEPIEEVFKPTNSIQNHNMTPVWNGVSGRYEFVDMSIIQPVVEAKKDTVNTIEQVTHYIPTTETIPQNNDHEAREFFGKGVLNVGYITPEDLGNSTRSKVKPKVKSTSTVNDDIIPTRDVDVVMESTKKKAKILPTTPIRKKK